MARILAGFGIGFPLSVTMCLMPLLAIAELDDLPEEYSGLPQALPRRTSSKPHSWSVTYSSRAPGVDGRMRDLLYAVSKKLQNNSKTSSVKACVDGECEIYVQSVPLGRRSLANPAATPLAGGETLGAEQKPASLIQRLSAFQGIATTSESDVSQTMDFDLQLDQDAKYYYVQNPDLADDMDKDMHNEMDEDIKAIRGRMSRQMQELHGQMEELKFGGTGSGSGGNRKLKVTSCRDDVCSTNVTTCGLLSCYSRQEKKKEDLNLQAAGTPFVPSLSLQKKAKALDLNMQRVLQEAKAPKELATLQQWLEKQLSNVKSLTTQASIQYNGDTKIV